MIIRKALFLSFCLTSYHLFFVSWVGGKDWDDLCRWDCRWYKSIVSDGYHSPIPPVREQPHISNTAFFPGYPMMAIGLKKIVPISTPSSLILAAQLMSFVMWFFVFLLFFDIYQLSTEKTLLFLLPFLAFPASMYLMVAYSESTFLASIVAFLYFSIKIIQKPEKVPLILYCLASISGIYMTSTRLVGIFLAPLPLCLLVDSFYLDKKIDFPKLIPAMALTFISLFGAGMFFLYCELVIGKWDIYFQTVKIGWDVYVDWNKLGSILDVLKWPVDGNDVDPIGYLVYVIGIVGIPMLIMLQDSKSWKDKIFNNGTALLLLAWILWIYTGLGRTSLSYRGMSRYFLPVLLLVICSLANSLSLKKIKQLSPKWIYLYFALIFSMFGMQSLWIRRFVSKMWVS